MIGKLALLGIVLLVHAQDAELEEFLEKDIKIYFSSAPTFNLGLDEEKGVVVSHPKYINPSKFKFITRARLVRSGSKFVLVFGENNICKDGNSAVKCRDERLWDLDRKPFGYTISTDGKCISKGDYDSVDMKPCVNTDDQILHFKTANMDGCGSLGALLAGAGGSAKPGTTNVNILPPGSYVASAAPMSAEDLAKKNIVIADGVQLKEDPCVECERDADRPRHPYGVRMTLPGPGVVVKQVDCEESSSSSSSSGHSAPVLAPAPAPAPAPAQPRVQKPRQRHRRHSKHRRQGRHKHAWNLSKWE